MKSTKWLGLLVASAVLLTACGSKDKAEETTTQPKQVVVTPEQDQTTEATEKSATDEGEKKTEEAAKQEPEKKAEQAPAQGNKGTVQPSTSSTAKSNQAAGKASVPASSSQTTAPKPQGETAAGHLELFVTEYFGSSTVFNQSVGYKKDQLLLDVMRDHLDVETAYGGGFVNAINGTKSGYTDKSIFTRKKRDWFYYVNGSVGAVGADQIEPRNGDFVWWDYHDWTGGGSNASAVVGAYPHPFTTGYNGAQPGTVIYYSGNHAEDASRLAQGLSRLGAGNVQTKPYADGNILTASTNAIVLGTWSELSGQAAMQQVFGSPKDTGVYASFDGDVVQALTYQGKNSGVTGQGAILATGQGNGDTSPLWLVIGSTEAGLDQAVDLMVNGGGKLKGKIGVVVNGGNAVGVPAEQ